MKIQNNNTRESVLTEYGEEARMILKTVLLLEKPYAEGYIIRLMQGESPYGWKSENHANMETLGSLTDMPFPQLQQLIRYLVKNEYLKVTDKRTGGMSVGDKGEQLLNENTSLKIHSEELRVPWHDYYLNYQLRNFRTTTAEKNGRAPYELFNNYTLQLIVEQKPTVESKLRYLPGMLNFPNPWAKEILSLVEEVCAKMEQTNNFWLYEKVYTPSRLRIKALYDSGMTVEEIAKAREVQELTIERALIDLHQANEIDFKAWMEENVNHQDFYRGTEYFRQVGNPRLKEAKDVLGLDYDTLRMCRADAMRAEEPYAEYA